MTATQSLNRVEDGNKIYEALFHKDLELIRSEMATKKDSVEISKEIGDVRAEISNLLKWMIGLFIPLYLSIIGLIISILLKK